MNTQSNLYTVIYASVLVVVVAALLSFAAISLQPTQEKNIKIEKKRNILSAVGIETTVENAKEEYKKYVVDEFVLDNNGNVKEGEAFTVDLKKEMAEKAEDRNLPIFKCVKNDSTFVVVPLRGKGLWGPVWGYISLLEVKKKIPLKSTFIIETDTISGDTISIKEEPHFKYQKSYSTVYGAVFDHKGETPGLGAEINKKSFQAPFEGIHIFDKDGNYTPIAVVKGGAHPESINEVDAISGGTITSKGVEAMLDSCLKNYQKFFKNEK